MDDGKCNERVSDKGDRNGTLSDGKRDEGHDV